MGCGFQNAIITVAKITAYAITIWPMSPRNVDVLKAIKESLVKLMKVLQSCFH